MMCTKLDMLPYSIVHSIFLHIYFYILHHLGVLGTRIMYSKFRLINRMNVLNRGTSCQKRPMIKDKDKDKD